MQLISLMMRLMIGHNKVGFVIKWLSFRICRIFLMQGSSMVSETPSN